MRIAVKSRLPVLCVALGIACPVLASPEDFFEKKIRPALIDNCFGCHSSATDAVKGELLLDSAAGLARGGKSGQPAVTPGDPAASRLMRAIRYQHPELQMPPSGPLPETVVADFDRWIREGAVFPESDAPIDLFASARKHWAFHPPAPQALPAVQDTAWPRTEIDHFILAKIEEAGLAPAPEADRRTLIRRLSFGLLGLPPAPEEVVAFENDPDPRAYENLVERYLASPHYGERWARHWLDVARYADTKGYVYGGREEVKFVHSHVYRDWVVDAMNRDRPYDEFLKLQIAADEMSDESSRADLAAMGFLTLGQRFLGVMPDIVDDRIDTVTRGLMGLTVSCARCHDHKFDPVPIEDYYSLYGVFTGSSERRVPIEPEYAEDPAWAEFTAEMQKREQALRERFREETEKLETRLRSQVDRYLAAVPDANKLPTDEFYEIRNEEDINPTIVRRWAAYIARLGEDDPVFGPWNRLASIPPDQFADRAPEVLARYAPPRDGDIVLASAAQSATQAAAPVLGALLEGAAPDSLTDAARRYGALFKSVEDEWIALVKAAEENAVEAPAALPDPGREAIRQIMVRDGSPIRVPEGAIVDLEWMFAEPARVELGRLYAEIDRWIIESPAAPPFAVTLADKPDMPAPRVFGRGNPANPGPQVSRQFLEILEGPGRQPFQHGSGRREMAEAIASADNPLTARVMVNRVWGWHFGEGIVATPSDFGTRAADPSHPELLDWLADYFIAEGWSIKQIHRQIVLSSAYRQSSASPADDPRVTKAMQVDPENRLLWRFNRYRLDFESLRDAILFASGEIDLALGGRPVDIAREPYPARRTIYARVDRQFLPPVFRMFDFPSPDMHSPRRLDTTVPQQALFLMNNPFVQAQAKAFAGRAAEAVPEAGTDRIAWFFQHAYQRAATPEQAAQSLAFMESAITPPPPPAVEPSAWTYGYGRFDEAAGAMASFTPIPHFNGTAYQGGRSWPDDRIGWVQITAEGGHPGNDLDHAIARRWTAPESGVYNIEGRIVHQSPNGDGIMARILSSRHGVLGAWMAHNSQADTNLYGIAVEAGDTLDFEVDIRKVLNSDEHLWAPVITRADTEDSAMAKRWDARAEFAGPWTAPPEPLGAWEKYAQVLLSSNEFMFVD
ncbi:MAG: PSD1 domain-containing protein [Candidatus Hydrogenedentes bacterium]|nr:PSD1 domain-containing protein [Candidatus Hydrogenedentota bacterium]